MNVTKLRLRVVFSLLPCAVSYFGTLLFLTGHVFSPLNHVLHLFLYFLVLSY